MRKRKSEPEAPKRPHFLPCGHCLQGYRRVIKQGTSMLAPCKCLLDHRAGRTHQPIVIDFKSRACGEDGDMVA